MNEIILDLSQHHPIEILGVNDKYLSMIREFYPKLKIIPRGESLKVVGNQEELANFRKRFGLLLLQYEQLGHLTENDIFQIMQGEPMLVEPGGQKSAQDILVHGTSGLQIKARTPNQVKMVESSATNDLVFAVGPAGTGKTYTAVALAVRALKNKEVKRIILTRPAVEAGENLGFLPGDLRDKLDPYLQPLYDALRDMIPTQKLLTYMEDGTIEIAPLAFMRGRTLGNAFAILDEAQNATVGQLKMFITRMGRNSKFVVTGDITQIDLPKNQKSGLVQAIGLLQEIPGISFIFLDDRDILRHNLVSRIIKAYDQETNKNE